jgi:Leucine-rich repeat (LRR) protein
MERIFCIYCKNEIQNIDQSTQICSYCSQYINKPFAKLFKGVFINEREVKTLKKLELELNIKIYYKGTKSFNLNEFEIDDDYSVVSLKLNYNSGFNFPDLLYDFKNLRELRITSRSLKHIPHVSFKFSVLEDLSFYSCSFENFPSEIFKFTKLKSLLISGTQIKIIPKDIRKLKNLEYLKLHNNKIEIINKNIKFLKKLYYLDLGCNCLQTIPKELFKLNLQVLKIHVNKLEHIHEEIIQLNELRTLEVYSNKFSMIPELPKMLEYLDVSSNFELEDIIEFSKLVNLKILVLTGNKTKFKKKINNKLQNQNLTIKSGLLDFNEAMG